jgi:vacuolar-type H+-ATPase subunit I/STV1
VFSGIIVALLHSLNIALVLFSPSIHSMRLAFRGVLLEVFMGGSVVYKPFKKGLVDDGGTEPLFRKVRV